MALPSLKNIEWVTTDCYGTLIDWERGIIDACRKEAEKDGFSFEERPFIDRFMEVQAEIMGGATTLTPDEALDCARDTYNQRLFDLLWSYYQRKVAN